MSRDTESQRTARVLVLAALMVLALTFVVLLPPSGPRRERETSTSTSPTTPTPETERSE